MNTQVESNMQAGLYGKLPSYGDFIFRNLNTGFITPWDEWLQHFICGSQEQIGEGWLDIYLTSPIWRFTLSPGVIDSNMWAGLMMPSVDRVGRYFPISIVRPFTSNISPVKFMLEQSAWYAAAEQHCLSALNAEMDADELVAAIAAIDVTPSQDYQATYHLGEMGPVLFAMDACDVEPEGGDSSAIKNTAMNRALPYMLNATLSTSLCSFSLWQTSGSELVSPVLFSCQGLPPIGALPSMLDGQWQQRDWKIPYNLA